MSTLSAVLLTLSLVACGKKEPAPASAANVPTEAKPEDKKPDEAKPEDKKPDETKPEEKKAEPAPEAKTDGAAPVGDSGFPATVKDEPTALVTATPGTVVKAPVADSPEWLIQQVLVAAMEPDEAKGWALFESLLHPDEKIGTALTTRRSMNFAASRRKVKLFLFEDPNTPVYKVSRVVEESPKSVRIYVFNNSEGGMPTPCEVRMDDASKKWKIGICSL